MKARLPAGYGGGGSQNMQGMLKQAQKMQEQVAQVQEELKTKEYNVSSGGGAVKILISGEKEIKQLELSPDIVDPTDIEMLSDLIIAAINEAIRTVESASEAEMSKITGGMSMGGMGGLF